MDRTSAKALQQPNKVNLNLIKVLEFLFKEFLPRLHHWECLWGTWAHFLTAQVPGSWKLVNGALVSVKCVAGLKA